MSLWSSKNRQPASMASLHGPADKQLRDQLVQEGKLIDSPDPDLYLFADDIPFNSPSAAAAVVFGGNQAGPTVWKTKDGLDIPRVARGKAGSSWREGGQG